MLPETVDRGTTNALADTVSPASGAAASGRDAGTKVGRYVILERVGAGGMGVVFAAYDPELDRRVAIKLLAANRITQESRLRLLREAQAMARLSHPNVVPVYDAGTVDGLVFVAMEFVQGVTVRDWLAGGARPWTDVLDTMRRAGLGLQAAHEAELVHRDFKPDNVMVGDDGRVRVLDFGLARSMTAYAEPAAPTDEEGSEREATAISSALTLQGTMVGTPAYMAPEQREGGEVDARTDQWSFCVALYEALYGSRPFKGDTEAAFVLAMHHEGVRPPPDASPVPRSVFAALVRGLELEPEARHSSMAALLDALELRSAPRRRVLPAALTAVGAVVVLSSWWSSDRADEACESRGLAAAAVWSLEAQQAGAAAFGRSSSTPSDYGPEAWTRASAQLTEYATAWGQEAGRACRAAGPETAEVDALRNHCLDARLRRLTTVVETFANADDHVVREAVSTVYELPPLEPCSDVPALLATARLPDDPATMAAVARLEQQLETVASLSMSGDYVEGRELAKAVVNEARAVDYAPFTAEALTTLAGLETRLDDFEAARDASVEAFELAAGVHDEPRAAKAATQLGLNLTWNLHSSTEAEVWLTVAASMVARAEGTQRALGADLRMVMGHAAQARGDYERALVEHSAARDIWEALPGDHPLELATTFHGSATTLKQLGRLGESRDHFLRALQVQEQTLGPNHPRVATTLGQLGTVALAAGDVAEARSHLERALAVRRASFPPGHSEIVAGMVNLGSTLSWSGEFERAIEVLEEALELQIALRGPEHPEVARTLHNLAAAYVLQGGHDDEAEVLYRREVAIRRKALGADHPVLALGLRDLGELLLVQDKQEEGLRLIEEALAIRTKTLGPDHPEVVAFWFSLSRAHDANGHEAAALDAAREAVAAAERSGATEFELGRARALLGQLSWRLGEDRAEARRLVEHAAAMMAKTPDYASGQQAELREWLRLTATEQEAPARR